MEKVKISNRIRKRYSPRAYQKTKLSEETIESLFESARWAPSAFNSQPWRFIYATPDQEEYWDKLFDCLIDFNKQWVNNAPFLMLGLTQVYDVERDKPRRNAEYQLGLAMGNLINQAGDMGLHMRQMTGFSPEKAIENFDIPSLYEPIVMAVAGYEDSQDDFSERMRVPIGEERTRKPLEKLIFNGDWDRLL
jgi:nitroreductase